MTDRMTTDEVIQALDGITPETMALAQASLRGAAERIAAEHPAQADALKRAETAETEVKRLGLMVDKYAAGARQLSDKLREARARIAELEARDTDAEVRAVQGWMALDLHTALGRDTDHYVTAAHQGHGSWADWWADLCAEVRRAVRGSISSHTYEGDGGPCTSDFYGQTCDAARDDHDLIQSEREQPAEPLLRGVPPETHVHLDTRGATPEQLADAATELAEAYRAYQARRHAALADAMRTLAAAFRTGGTE